MSHKLQAFVRVVVGSVVGVLVVVEVVQEMLALCQRVVASVDRWMSRTLRNEGKELHRSEMHVLGAALASQLHPRRQADSSR